MRGAPLVSVLIPAFNEERFLAPTLAAVHESFRAVGHADYEIVVCDNNSTDRTAEVAAAGGARVVAEPHNQMARARNAAARAARGEWFIFLDADTRLDADLLRATLGRLSSGKVGGGGALVRLDTSRPGAIGATYLWCWNRLSAIRKLAPGLYIYCLRRAWEEIHGFDEEFYYFEDIFFSKKLRAWCRANGLVVSIIGETRVETSARKIQWYGGWHLARQLLKVLAPNALKQREPWAVWYERPGGGPPDLR